MLQKLAFAKVNVVGKAAFASFALMLIISAIVGTYSEITDYNKQSKRNKKIFFQIVLKRLIH